MKTEFVAGNYNRAACREVRMKVFRLFFNAGVSCKIFAGASFDYPAKRALYHVQAQTYRGPFLTIQPSVF